MLILVTRETIITDVSRDAQARIGRALGIPANMVQVEWRFQGSVPAEPGDTGALVPDITLAFPPILPPAELDVNDPVAFGAWQDEHADMPTVEEFLRGRGIKDPKPIIDRMAALMVGELKTRWAAWRESAA